MLLGTWGGLVIGLGALYTYKPDHTCVSWADDRVGQPSETARWRLEGDDIVISRKSGDVRNHILSLTETELRVRFPDGQTFTFNRIE